MTDTSDKLKTAMAEIHAILKKYDIAGHVLLQEPGYAEYLNAIEPSWSILRFEAAGIRIRSKLQEDYNGDRARQHFEAESTVNMIKMFADVLQADAELFDHLHDLLAKQWEIEHTGLVHTPDRKQ